MENDQKAWESCQNFNISNVGYLSLDRLCKYYALMIIFLKPTISLLAATNKARVALERILFI